MTASLKRAFAEASRLPESAQEQLAEQLLEDIAGELQWDRTLAHSQDVLEKLLPKPSKPDGTEARRIRVLTNCENGSNG